MDGRQVVSPLDLSLTLLAGDGLLVPYSLSGSPVIKQLMQMVTMVSGQGGGFSQCASPNIFSESLGLTEVFGSGNFSASHTTSLP